MITVRNLSHAYSGSEGPVVAVDDVSFEVPAGEFFTLLGPSGCGKTTTLRCIAGLERPTSGEIALGKTVVVSPRSFVPTHLRPIGMVFQNYAVWPHLTVFENVAFPLRVARSRMTSNQIRLKVEHALETVGLAGFGGRMSTQLSGGQQQRLSLARAIVREPEVLLLDEPLSNLDARLRGEMRIELREIQRRIKVTTLFVTHDQLEALSMSNTIAVMDRGRLVQVGKPQHVYREPKNSFVARFLGSTNLIPARTVQAPKEQDPGTYTTSLGTLWANRGSETVINASSDDVLIAIRPEDVLVHQERPDNKQAVAVVEAEVELSAFLGDSRLVHLRAGGQALTATVPSRQALRPGECVFVELPAYACLALPD